MKHQATTRSPRRPQSDGDRRWQRMERWKLEDAKAKFSEVVRRANSSGPQLITVRGEETAVVMSANEFERLLPHRGRELPLVDFLQSLNLREIFIEREHDTGREIVLP